MVIVENVRETAFWSLHGNWFPDESSNSIGVGVGNGNCIGFVDGIDICVDISVNIGIDKCVVIGISDSIGTCISVAILMSSLWSAGQFC